MYLTNLKKMKRNKNIKVEKNKFTQFCKAALLSLFVVLTIPSISSGIFGSSDAHAGCNQKSGTNATFEIDDAFIDALCKTDTADSNACKEITPGTGTIDGVDLCKAAGISCDTLPSNSIRCTNIKSMAACISTGSASGNCQWTVEDVDNNKLVDAVCRVYQIATGTAGKAFAAVGVISVGIGFFTGKVSWGLMISVAAGIAVFFGAPSIIAVISGDQSATSLCSNVSR